MDCAALVPTTQSHRCGRRHEHGPSEVLDLYPALVDEGAQTVIRAAEADAECSRKRALRQGRVVLEQAQGAEMEIFGHGRCADAGWGDGRSVGRSDTLPPYPVVFGVWADGAMAVGCCVQV